MQDNSRLSSLGAGLIVCVAAFSASWFIVLSIAESTGLALVFSVFVALIAFDIGRRSLKQAFAIIGVSILVMLLYGIYFLFI